MVDLATASADPFWQTLLRAKLRLGTNIRFHRQRHREQDWIVVHNPARNQFFKTTLLVHSLLLRLDGKRSLQAIIDSDAVIARAFVEDPGQSALIAKLLEAGVVTSDLPLDREKELETKNRALRQQRLGKWLKPWFFKVSLCNPDPMLNRLQPYTGWLWTKPVFCLWLAFIAFTLIYGLDSWSALKTFWREQWWHPQSIVLAACVYPFMKIMHELAHGLSVKNWGGQVNDSGVALLFFVPVPYVDASASLCFPERQQRMVVAAAGIIMETGLAAAAFWLWLASGTLWVQLLSFNVLVLGAVASLLFNGNPLLRYDGYYIFSEAVQIPNLSQRSRALLGYLYRKHALGLPEAEPQVAPGELKWLLGYGVIAGLYRVLLSLTIAFFIMGKYFFIGVVLGFWAIVSQMLQPAGRWFTEHLALARKHRVLVRFGAGLGGVTLIVGVLLFVLPLRNADHVQGLLMLPGEQEIKAASDGFVSELLVQPGQPVLADQALLTMSNHALAQRIEILKARLAQTGLLLNQQLIEDPAQAGWYRDELQNLRQELDNLEREAEGLMLAAPHPGRVQFADRHLAQGTYFAKGDLIGAVLNAEFEGVFVLNEAQAYRLQHKRASVAVKLAADIENELAVHNYHLAPKASDTLPSRFLGQDYGGAVATDLSDPRSLRTNAPMFGLTLRLSSDAELRPGARLVVRLVYDDAPLALRLYGYLRRRLLERLGW